MYIVQMILIIMQYIYIKHQKNQCAEFDLNENNIITKVLLQSGHLNNLDYHENHDTFIHNHT